MVTRKGFSLIDLLIVLSIISITLGIGIPSFDHLLKQNQSRTTMRQLATVLNYARTLAVSSTEVVTICPWQNNSCGKDWQKGLLIFIDKNNNGKRDHSENVDRVELTDLSGDLRWRAFGSKRYLKYRPSGSAFQQNGSFTYCPENLDPRYAHQLIINNSGRIRFAVDSDKNGIREDSFGKDLNCQQ